MCSYNKEDWTELAEMAEVSDTVSQPAFLILHIFLDKFYTSTPLLIKFNNIFHLTGFWC